MFDVCVFLDLFIGYYCQKVGEGLALPLDYELALVARLLRLGSGRLLASAPPCTRLNLSHFLDPIPPLAPTPRL